MFSIMWIGLFLELLYPSVPSNWTSIYGSRQRLLYCSWHCFAFCCMCANTMTHYTACCKGFWSGLHLPCGEGHQIKPLASTPSLECPGLQLCTVTILKQKRDFQLKQYSPPLPPRALMELRFITSLFLLFIKFKMNTPAFHKGSQAGSVEPR